MWGRNSRGNQVSNSMKGFGGLKIRVTSMKQTSKRVSKEPSLREFLFHLVFPSGPFFN